MEVFDDQSADWNGRERIHYDRSIVLLIEALQRDQNESSPNSPDDMATALETSRHAGSVLGSKG